MFYKSDDNKNKSFQHFFFDFYITNQDLKKMIENNSIKFCMESLIMASHYELIDDGIRASDIYLPVI